MRKLGLLVVAVLLVALALWLALREGADREAGDEEPATSDPAASGSSVEPRPSTSSSSVKTGPRRSPQARQARRIMRQRILDAHEARERAAERDGTGPSAGSTTGGREDAGSGSDSAGTAAPRPPESTPITGGLVDRTGSRGYLVEVMNRDLMPLADECIALARETEPALRGMLVLDFEIITDEEIGGIVESVAPGQSNEVPSPDLLECMRESILATTLPPPPQGGRDAISISMPLSPDDGAAGDGD